MKSSVIICPFSLFGSPGAAQGANLIADALRELFEDNRQERRPTRARAYQSQVRVKELSFPDESAFTNWRKMARESVKQVVSAGDFLFWIGGNHLSVLPVYEEFGAIEDTLVVQLDAHLDLYNLRDNPAHLNHGNFLKHADGPLPSIVNIGHRDLFLTERSIRPYFRHAIPASAFAIDPQSVFDLLREQLDAAQQVFIDIDCDVLDPSDFPATSHPMPFGITPQQLLRVIEICWSDKLRGISFSEFDPGRDRNDQGLSLLVWLLEYLFLKRHE